MDEEMADQAQRADRDELTMGERRRRKTAGGRSLSDDAERRLLGLVGLGRAPDDGDRGSKRPMRRTQRGKARGEIMPKDARANVRGINWSRSRDTSGADVVMASAERAGCRGSAGPP